jgi:hypothetical protein
MIQGDSLNVERLLDDQTIRFHGTRMSFSVLTKSCHWTLTEIIWMQSTPLHPIFLRFSLTLSYIYDQVSRVASFPEGSRLKYMHFNLPIRKPTARHFHFYFIDCIIYGEDYKLQSLFMCSSVHQISEMQRMEHRNTGRTNVNKPLMSKRALWV